MGFFFLHFSSFFLFSTALRFRMIINIRPSRGFKLWAVVHVKYIGTNGTRLVRSAKQRVEITSVEVKGRPMFRTATHERTSRWSESNPKRQCRQNNTLWRSAKTKQKDKCKECTTVLLQLWFMWLAPARADKWISGVGADKLLQTNSRQNSSFFFFLHLSRHLFLK